MSRTVILGLSPVSDKQGPSAFRGKFLQLVWRGQEYLLFALFQRHAYHNQILAEFCNNNAIPCRWATEELLVVDTPELTVIGGGRFEISPSRKSLALWDNSQIYGRFQTKGLADKIAASDHPCSRYTITIR